MLSPDHIDHPYPTEEEKARIMRHCGIEMKQLTNWFVNNRKRIWKPKLEEMKKRQDENGVVVSIEEEEVKSKKLCVKIAKTHSGVKAANSKKLKVKVPGSGSTGIITSSALIKYRTSTVSPTQMGDASVYSEAMPPLPPPVAAATVTPLVDPMIISSFTNEEIAAAPMLPMPGVSDQGGAGFCVMPHSCNLMDPLTNKMVSSESTHL